MATHMGSLMKLVQPADLDLLHLIRERGLIDGKMVETPGLKKALMRCEATGLISPVRVKGNYYKYYITDLGLELPNQKEQPADKTKQYQV